MRFFAVTCFVLYLLLPHGLLAQNKTYGHPLDHYIFQHIDNSMGLLNNQVTALAQDHRGFMWIGSKKGLQRYDGFRFSNYHDTCSAPGERIFVRNILPDTANVIWLPNGSRLTEFNRFQNKFICHDLRQWMDRDATQYEDGTGRFWSINRIIKFSKTLSGQLLLVEPEEGGIYLAPFVRDTVNHHIWIVKADQSDLLLFEETSQKLYNSTSNPLAHPLLTHCKQLRDKGLVFRNVTIDHRGNIWITTWGPDFFRYDTRSNEMSSYSINDIIKNQGVLEKLSGSANIIMEDHQSTIWIGTMNAGLLQYNPVDDNFNYILFHYGNSSGIHYDYEIDVLYQDQEQNIWVGTDKGISIFNPIRQHFVIIENQPGNKNSLPKSEINAVIEMENSDLLIGTWGGGITVYDSSLHFKQTISFEDVVQKNQIWSFVQDDDGAIWVGCQHGYLHILNPADFSVHTIHPPELENSTITCMRKDSDGNIYLGLYNGKIVQWNYLEKKFNSTLHSTLPVRNGIMSILNMFIDQQQNLWVSTTQGFRQFDLLQQGFVTSYLVNKHDSNSLSSPITYGVEEYNDSMLLIGTEEGGLNLFNKNKAFFSQYMTQGNQPSSSVYAIKKDASGNFWFTSGSEIHKIIGGTNEYITYRPFKEQVDFSSSHFVTTKRGQWFTWNSEKVLGFYPDSINNLTENNNPVSITGIEVFDQPFPIDSTILNDLPLHLSYDENFLDINFADIQYSATRQIEYYHRLSGVDRDWVSTGAVPSAHYTNLPPGEFVFEVKTNNTAKKITSIKIIIAPPLWKTTSFIIGISIICLYLVYLIVTWRIRNIKAIEREKLKVQKLNAEQYKSKLEMEQIINYFSTSLIGKSTVDEVLWDVAKNLISQLGFVDCILYVWNQEKTKMVHKASFGFECLAAGIDQNFSEVGPGQGVVGEVIKTSKALLVSDTSLAQPQPKDTLSRVSEISVPVIYNNEILGVIDSGHQKINFFTQRHLQILTTIATLMANKINSIQVNHALQNTQVEMYSMNEQLSRAKLQALQSQMNPHFIFNCINSIDALIQSNDKYRATIYLNKFAKLIRNILENSKQDTVSLSKDLETLKLYIELEQLRHENKFVAEINVSETILQEDYKIPPLIIQPFVENAILHGIQYRKDNAGKLLIHITKEGPNLKFHIEDNGVGRNGHRRPRQIDKKALGVEMSSDRIRLFNSEETASVEIIDLYSDRTPSGTQVEVFLKIEK